MADDSDGEGFYDDPFEDASDGDDSCVDEEDDSCVDEEDDDGCLGLCGGPSDEEGDDDSNGEEMCEVPCCFDDDDDSDHEDLCLSPCDDEVGGESEEAFCDDDDDVQGEEVCDEEGNGGDSVDDPCDEDEDEERDGEAEDLCEDPSSNDGGEGEREVFCVSGFSTADGTDISGSVQDDSSSEEEEDNGLMPIALPRLPTPAPLTVQILMDTVYTDSDDDIDVSDDTDYDSDEYELHRLPVSRAVVESLPEVTLSEEEAARGCAVCKDVFASGQRVVWLPCKHYFHGDCIRPWLAIRSTCPVCRYQLPTDDAESRQARQLGFLVPVALPLARRGESQQSGGRDGGDGGGATTGGTGDARD